MLRIRSAAVLAALAAAGCGDGDKEVRLHIDAWWTLDYAKNACERASATAAECVFNGSPAANHFIDQLMAQLASNTRCKGVTIVRYDGPDKRTSAAQAAFLAKPHYTIIPDFVAERATQRWSLVRANAPTMEGEGDPAAIAASVCTIVTGGGARVSE